MTLERFCSVFLPPDRSAGRTAAGGRARTRTLCFEVLERRACPSSVPLPVSATSAPPAGTEPASQYAPPSHDVNGDGSCTPADPLAVINSLNERPEFSVPASGGEGRLDVNRDGAVTPLDVLILVNDLNANGSRSIRPNLPPVDPARDAVFRAIAGESVAFDLGVTDPDGDRLVYSLARQSGAATIAVDRGSGRVTFTGAEAGTWVSFIVRVEEEEGSGVMLGCRRFVEVMSPEAADRV